LGVLDSSEGVLDRGGCVGEVEVFVFDLDKQAELFFDDGLYYLYK
jgi:hypothetical protein